MTNILAAITFTITTNWMTTSITKPVVGNPLHAVYQPETEHQIGARVTNTLATFVWSGKTNSVVIESTPAFYSGDIKRDVTRSPGPVLYMDAR